MPVHARRLLHLVALALAVSLAAPAPARPRKETPEKLYEQGVRQMKRGYYEEAIVSFDKVRNHFPLNQYSVLAELRVADCLYEKADYISAVDAYQQFVRLHPRHPELDYAYLRVGKAYFKQANRIPQKDQTYTEMVLAALEGYEERFPESDYLAEAQEMRGKCTARLSKAEAQVGDFYYWRKSWHAASRRYESIVGEFGDEMVARRAQFRLGVCYFKMAEDEALDVDIRRRLLHDAQELLGRTVEQFPGTQQSRRAERALPQVQLALDALDASPPPAAPAPDPEAAEAAGAE